MAVLSLVLVFVLGGVLSCDNETVQTSEQTPPPGASPFPELTAPAGAAPPPKPVTTAPEVVSPTSEPTPEEEVTTSGWEPWTGDLAGAC